jgi:hypothetical protein
MRKWSNTLALVVSLSAVVGLSAMTASAADVIIQPVPNAVIIQPQPQPGAVVIQPEPSAAVVQPAPVTVLPAPASTVVILAQPWCAGVYAPGLGSNFGPCPGVVVQGH